MSSVHHPASHYWFPSGLLTRWTHAEGSMPFLSFFLITGFQQEGHSGTSQCTSGQAAAAVTAVCWGGWGSRWISGKPFWFWSTFRCGPARHLLHSSLLSSPPFFLPPPPRLYLPTFHSSPLCIFLPFLFLFSPSFCIPPLPLLVVPWVLHLLFPLTCLLPVPISISLALVSLLQLLFSLQHLSLMFFSSLYTTLPPLSPSEVIPGCSLYVSIHIGSYRCHCLFNFAFCWSQPTMALNIAQGLKPSSPFISFPHTSYYAKLIVSSSLLEHSLSEFAWVPTAL